MRVILNLESPIAAQGSGGICGLISLGGAPVPINYSVVEDRMERRSRMRGQMYTGSHFTAKNTNPRNMWLGLCLLLSTTCTG
jgi:hypothetical protein